MQSSRPMCHKRTVLSAEDDNKYCTDYFISILREKIR